MLIRNFIVIVLIYESLYDILAITLSMLSFSDERSGGYIRLRFISELAFSLFQFKRWVPYVLSCSGRSRFKLGEVDGCENDAIKLTFKPDISQEIDQISLQALPLITNYCKDCKSVCLYVFLAVLDFFWSEIWALKADLRVAICTKSTGSRRWTNCVPTLYGMGEALRLPPVPSARTGRHRLRLLKTSNFREGPYIRFATEVAQGEPPHNNHVQTLPRSISIHQIHLHPP
jgi:hypothetical protein